MIKSEIKVPKGIYYISDWKDYRLPIGEHCIVDKGVTGCGYTEFCLTNNVPIVLCSPRKLLLENKSEQHAEDENILYLKNEISDYDGVLNMEAKVLSHLDICFNEINDSPKFLVTYDSLHYLVDILERLGLLQNFIFVVDEFQSIFNDSYFKSSVEFDFVRILQVCPNVIYLSATPTLEKYLTRVPEFTNLNFYKLNWSDTNCVEQMKFRRFRVRSLGGECDKIIKRYQSGQYETAFNEKGEIIQSKEAVFYFNSVTEIVRLVSKNKLTPENTRIICADTPENRNKLKRLGFKPERVPLKNEANPMFMFCTATSYIGIDMYSDCASSFVFADPNISSLALDISMDLPQIVGRQRNKANPFKNNIVIFYKTSYKEISKEEFDASEAIKKNSTNILLREFRNMSLEGQVEYLRKLKESVESSKYSSDFVGISRLNNEPVYNYFIEIANERAWEVSQRDYQDSITVTRALEKIGYTSDPEYKESENIVNSFLRTEFEKLTQFSDKLKSYCLFSDSFSENPLILNLLNEKIKDPRYYKYYSFYGTSGCSSKKFRESNLESGLVDLIKEDALSDRVYSAFKENTSYPKNYIKQELQNIYTSLELSKTAKASDIENFYEVSRARIKNSSGKYDEGYKIIKRK